MKLRFIETGAEVGVEVVSTPERIQRGLMYRTSLGKDNGMLFLFPTVHARAVWMKNTLIPLDVLFLQSYGQGKFHVSGTVEHTVPLSEEIRQGPVSNAMLEVNDGWIHSQGIRVGHHCILLPTTNA